MAAASWSNWSGSVRASGRVERPATLDALAAIVQGARQVRAVGAGHSFMPLCDSDDVILSLSDLAGEIEPGGAEGELWLPAGWSLAALTQRLWHMGLSLANQGDVNPQTLAGAVSTATHGTGRALGSLATFATGFRLIDHAGELREIVPADGETFRAARLSLGLLGVLVAIRMKVVPAFGLREDVHIVPVDDLLRDFHAATEGQPHGEFFVFPYAETAYFKQLTPIDPPTDEGPSSDFGEAAFRAACEAGRRLPATIPTAQRTMMRGSRPSTRSGPAFRIFPSDRTVRFEEMEYHFPQGAGLAALRAARDHVRAHSLPVTFPFEFRTVAGDDALLTPFKAPVNESVAFHQYAPMEWRALFARVEPIFRDHGGRPHWGKRHTLTRDDVDALHPEARTFRLCRRGFDPAGKFLNPHLTALLA